MGDNVNYQPVRFKLSGIEPRIEKHMKIVNKLDVMRNLNNVAFKTVDRLYGYIPVDCGFLCYNLDTLYII